MCVVPYVTDEGVRTLALLTTLTYLDLSYCEVVSDGGLIARSPLTALTTLNVCGC